MTKNKNDKRKRASVAAFIVRLRHSRAYSAISDFISDIKDSLNRKHYHSLYLELALAAAFGILVSAAIYIAAQTGASLFINMQLASDIKKAERETEYVSALQEYANENNISVKNTGKLLDFEVSRYVQFVVYSDIPKEDSEPSERSTRDEMVAYAAEQDMFVIDLSDGSVMIAVNDFSEFYYYNVSASINFVMSLTVLVIVMLNQMRKMIRRIKQLQSDVAVVSYSDMNHEITVEGNNDIAKLAANVETMRIAILDNLRKEKEARDANTELITSLSHDIRTPLTVILGYLEMMEKKATDEEMREYIAVTEQTAMRLKLLSDDMFKYFLTYGNTQEKIKLEEYNAATLLFQMLTEHTVLLYEKGYEVSFDRGTLEFDDKVSVITDADNLMRIFDNVFSNIHKYADKNAPIKINISMLGDILAIEFKNKVKKDNSGTESNKIGLKTCARLAEFILEGFEYSEQNGVFTTRIAIKTTVADAVPEIQPLVFTNNI
ncbi:MAG: HAMP domain-containing histidine kinase [Clostridia bacterium]|nr:HAMP domain-containing histidine kinase [Clostridia bacterium]